MARTYEVEGTKSYLTAAIVLALLAIWHIVDGWVPQERWLEKYPEFPKTWYDLSLYEFYAYNRWTGILMSIASVVCAVIHRIVR
jgi:hypothetical protein